MSDVTVRQLAATLGVPVERLLSQLQDAGIWASEADTILTEQEKLQLLRYLRGSPDNQDGGTGAHPLRLVRKSVTEIGRRKAAPRGRNKRNPELVTRRTKTCPVCGLEQPGAAAACEGCGWDFSPILGTTEQTRALLAKRLEEARAIWRQRQERRASLPQGRLAKPEMRDEGPPGLDMERFSTPLPGCNGRVAQLVRDGPEYTASASPQKLAGRR